MRGQCKQHEEGPDGKIETVHIRSSEIPNKVEGKTLFAVNRACIRVPASATNLFVPTELPPP